MQVSALSVSLLLELCPEPVFYLKVLARKPLKIKGGSGLFGG